MLSTFLVVNVILTSVVPKYLRSSSSKLLQNVYKIISTRHPLSPFCHRSAPALSATNCTQFEHCTVAHKDINNTKVKIPPLKGNTYCSIFVERSRVQNSAQRSAVLTAHGSLPYKMNGSCGINPYRSETEGQKCFLTTFGQKRKLWLRRDK